MDDSGFIPGIYNYCDRWCERCAFTSRCRVFAMEQERAASAEMDADNASFWEELGQSLLDAQALIEESAREHGIDLDELMAEPAAPRRDRRLAAVHDKLVHEAEAYADGAHRWLELNQDRLEEKRDELLSGAAPGEPGADPARQVADIENALAVIHWYLVLIGAKLNRASEGQRDMEEENDNDLGGVGVAERDGSAKVALIGLDRSIAAWGRLYQHLLDAHEDILEILLQLNRLRRGVEQAFPHARTFIRPGLDGFD